MKQVSFRVVTGLVLTAILLTALAAYFAWASTPSNPIWIESGVYPGAPSYTVWREGSNYFAKNQYGYQSSSSTNASEVLENCINQLATSGKIQIFGTLTISTTVQVNKRVWFEGEYNGASSFNCLVSNAPMFNVTAAGVVFQNLYFSGNTKTGSGILFEGGSSYGKVEHCDFYNCQVAIAINVTTGTSAIVGSIIDNNIATNDIGIQFYATSGKWANDWQVCNNRIKSNTVGIQMGYGEGADSHTLISHNSIEGCTTGLDLQEAAYYSDIVFNRIEGCTTGINFESSLHNTRIQYNMFLSNIADIANTPYNSTLMQWNYGLNTVKWGNVTVSNGAGDIDVKHNLYDEPALILVTVAWDADSVWISAKNSTYFTVDWDTNPGADSTLYWYARYDFPD